MGIFAILSMVGPIVIRAALEAATTFLSPRNAKVAHHVANLSLQALDIGLALKRAHDEGREITDAEVQGATDAALGKVDDYLRTLEELRARQ